MQQFKKFVKRVPGVYPTYLFLQRTKNAVSSFGSPYVRMFPAGNFYSPLPDIKQVVADQDSLFNRDAKQCLGVDVGAERQLAVLNQFAEYYHEAPFLPTATVGHRYYYGNPFFKCGDAIVLYSMLRRLKPRRVIEVGSGYSSAVMLDTDEKFLGGRAEFTFVDPYPQRLFSLLTEADRRRCRVLETQVQSVPLAEFERLEAGDVLFVDSSHVVKIGSDVRHLLSEVLPRLKVGVVVHFHDIMWPFEYPADWVLSGNAWNEAYFLRAFLQYNSAFQIEYFNSYIAIVHRAAFESILPMCLENPGGGLWLRKTA